jgi:hypothetical protein
MLTYCSDCYITCIVENPYPPHQTPGKIVCDKCYGEKYHPQVILQKSRDEKLNQILKKTRIEKLTKWLKKLINV